MKDLLETLSNNKVQDILEEMGMFENGSCPHTAEEIFKAGVEYAQNHIKPNKAFIDKAYEFWHNALVKDKDPYKSVWLALVNTFKKEMTSILCDLSKVEKKGE